MAEATQVWYLPPATVTQPPRALPFYRGKNCHLFRTRHIPDPSWALPRHHLTSWMGQNWGRNPPGLLGLTPGSVSCKGSGCTHRLPEPKNPALWRPKSLTMRVSELITPSGTTCASLGDALLSPHCPACIPDLLPLSHWPYWWSWSQSRAWGNISALPPGTLVAQGWGRWSPGLPAQNQTSESWL